jgi:hypothetical protein
MAHGDFYTPEQLVEEMLENFPGAEVMLTLGVAGFLEPGR